jgi:hypothetical protein
MLGTFTTADVPAGIILALRTGWLYALAVYNWIPLAKRALYLFPELAPLALATGTFFCMPPEESKFSF